MRVARKASDKKVASMPVRLVRRQGGGGAGVQNVATLVSSLALYPPFAATHHLPGSLAYLVDVLLAHVGARLHKLLQLPGRQTCV